MDLREGTMLVPQRIVRVLRSSEALAPNTTSSSRVMDETYSKTNGVQYNTVCA